MSEQLPVEMHIFKETVILQDYLSLHKLILLLAKKTILKTDRNSYLLY
jgi:hypothetical protein